MRRLIDSFGSFDSFLRWQLGVGLMNRLVWALCAPIIHKLQGVYWTTAYISVYMFCMEASGLIFPLFRGTSLRELYRIIVILNTFYFLSLFLCFWDVYIFLVVETVLCIVASVFWPLLGIGWDVYVVEGYEKGVFEDFKYWESFRSAVGGVIGSVIVGVVSGLYDLDVTIMLFMCGMVCMVVMQYLNWYKFYREMR